MSDRIEAPRIGPLDVSKFAHVPPQAQQVTALTSYTDGEKGIDYRLRWRMFPTAHQYTVLCEVWTVAGWAIVWSQDHDSFPGADRESRAASINAAFNDLSVFVNAVLL